MAVPAYAAHHTVEAPVENVAVAVSRERVTRLGHTLAITKTHACCCPMKYALAATAGAAVGSANKNSRTMARRVSSLPSPGYTIWANVPSDRDFHG